jgi:hypothetical protein
MKKDTLEYRMSMANQRLKVSDSKLLNGSTKDKFPIIMDGGKTIIFISDKTKESETREKYEFRRDNKVISLAKKPHVKTSSGS